MGKHVVFLELGPFLGPLEHACGALAAVKCWNRDNRGFSFRLGEIDAGPTGVH